jgi:hypothetical protein
MKTLFSKRWITALRVTACMLVVMACQLPCLTSAPVGIPATPGENGAPMGESTPGENADPTNDLPSGLTAEAIPIDVIFGPGSFRLMDPTVGLSDLSSYQATLSLSFSGTQGGQSNQWSHTYVMLASQDNTAHQITIESTGGSPPPFFKAEMNGVSYELLEKGDCIGSTLEVGSSLSATWEPAGFLSGLIGAEAVGSETINGFVSDKYTFDERALGEAGFTQSTGQVWVASDNGVVVRYLLTTTAGTDYFGAGIEGTQTWGYNLTNVNQLVAIDLPSNCPGGLVDAPLMPAALNIRQLAGVTIFSISGSIQDVFAFYHAQLPVLGWEVTGEPVTEDTMGVAIFIQSDQQLSVIVMPTENGVEVRLMMGPAPESGPNP